MTTATHAGAALERVDDEPPFGPRLYRCPECGDLELTDSRLAGTCVLCGGFVKLVAA